MPCSSGFALIPLIGMRWQARLPNGVVYAAFGRFGIPAANFGYRWGASCHISCETLWINASWPCSARAAIGLWKALPGCDWIVCSLLAAPNIRQGSDNLVLRRAL